MFLSFTYEFQKTFFSQLSHKKVVINTIFLGIIAWGILWFISRNAWCRSGKSLMNAANIGFKFFALAAIGFSFPVLFFCDVCLLMISLKKRTINKVIEELHGIEKQDGELSKDNEKHAEQKNEHQKVEENEIEEKENNQPVEEKLEEEKEEKTDEVKDKEQNEEKEEEEEEEKEQEREKEKERVKEIEVDEKDKEEIQKIKKVELKDEEIEKSS